MKPPDSQTNLQVDPPPKERDWIPILLVVAILYLVLLLPFIALIGGKPEILGAAIGALATALVGIITVRAVRK